MIAGNSAMQMVEIDSAGVPSGGEWGDPVRFAKSIERYGLKLAWSWAAGMFLVYSDFGGGCEPLIQFDCWNHSEGRPIALAGELEFLLLWFWDNHCRNTRQTIRNAVRQGQRNMRAAQEKAMLARRNERAKIAFEQAGKEGGWLPKKLFVMPKHLRN